MKRKVNRKSVKSASLNKGMEVYADNENQLEVIKDIIPILDKKGIKVRFGARVGKSPQTIIFDNEFQDGALRINGNGYSSQYLPTWHGEEFDSADDLESIIDNYSEENDEYELGGEVTKKDSYEVGDKIKYMDTFRREENDGTIYQINELGTYIVSTGMGVRGVQKEEVIGVYPKEEPKKKRFGLFAEGGETPMARHGMEINDKFMRGGIAGDVYSLQNPEQFKELITIYNDLSEKTNLIKGYYLDHTDNSIVFLTTPNISDLGKDEIYSYVESLKKKGFSIINFDKSIDTQKYEFGLDWGTEKGSMVKQDGKEVKGNPQWFKLYLKRQIKYDGGGKTKKDKDAKYWLDVIYNDEVYGLIDNFLDVYEKSYAGYLIDGDLSTDTNDIKDYAEDVKKSFMQLMKVDGDLRKLNDKLYGILDSLNGYVGESQKNEENRIKRTIPKLEDVYIQIVDKLQFAEDSIYYGTKGNIFNDEFDDVEGFKEYVSEIIEVVKIKIHYINNYQDIMGVARNGMEVENWSASDVSNAEYLGIIEFEDAEGEFHNFEVMETEDRLVFGGMTNSGFIESGYIEKDGRSTDETLQNLMEDLEVYYNDGAEYTSEIVVNQRMANGGTFGGGGSIAEGNYHMILSQAKEVQHHVDELQDILKKEDTIEAWVVAKMENVSSTLSDVTHYLDGKSEMPMAKRGMKVGSKQNDITLTQSEKNQFRKMDSSLYKMINRQIELREECYDENLMLDDEIYGLNVEIEEFKYKLLQKYGNTPQIEKIIDSQLLQSLDESMVKGRKTKKAKHGMKVEEKIRVRQLDSGEIVVYTIDELLERINQDNATDEFNYDENDWIEGFNETLEGEFYSLYDENGKPLNPKIKNKIKYPTITLKEYDLNDDQTEIYAYIETRQELQSQYDTIRKNLMTKIARGEFDETKAPKLFMYLIENGLKLYSKNFGEIKLSKQEKEEIANNMVVDFMSEAELGNYENETFLPKKYLAENGMVVMTYDIYDEDGQLEASGLVAQDVVDYANLRWYYDMMDEDEEEIDDFDVAKDYLEQDGFNIESHNPEKSSSATKKRKIIRKMKK